MAAGTQARTQDKQSRSGCPLPCAPMYYGLIYASTASSVRWRYCWGGHLAMGLALHVPHPRNSSPSCLSPGKTGTAGHPK
jgi:hypothetical protein